MKKFLLKMILLTVFWTSTGFAQLLTNGSFESASANPGNSFIALSSGSTVIDNWVVGSGNIHYVGGYWVASDSSRSIDLNGSTTGSINQTFATTIGTAYEVRFDLAGNTDGQPTIKTVNVSAAGVSQNFTFDITGRSRSDMGWEERIFKFTAIDTSTILAFTSLDAEHFGPAIDNVRVKALITASGLYNTGVDDSGIAQQKGSIELHYTLTGPLSSAIVVDPLMFSPGNGWVEPPTGSAWIGPTPSNISDPVGLYIYTLSFDLTGLDPATFSLTGDVAADNSVAIFLNGNDTGFSHTNGFQALQRFSINQGFVADTNTLEFRVNNTQPTGLNPTGLLVANMTATNRPSTGTKVYVLSSNNANADQAAIDALVARGLSPIKGVRASLWNGTQVDLDTIDAVVLLNNYNFIEQMPLSGQDSLVNYVSRGGGLVTGEWAVWNVDFTKKYSRLDPIIPVDFLQFNEADSTTYCVVVPDPVLNDGLPNCMRFPMNSIDHGSESLLSAKTGAMVFYSSSNSGKDGVVGWGYQAGRAISFSTMITEIELSDSNYARLFANAVQWVARTCTYSIIPTTREFPAAGGTGSVLVTASASGCTWIAVSNDSWVTITSESSGAGNGTVVYEVAPNSSGNVRRGMIVIAGHEFVVEQLGDGTNSRVIRVVDSDGSPNSKVEVPIVLESQGDENALGFSLEFDTNVLVYDTTSRGQDSGNVIPYVNDSQKGTGKIGFVVALPAGQTFVAGSRELVVVSFTVGANTDVDSTMIAFIDQPVVREVVDINANQLPASWQRGTVRIFRGLEGDVMPRPGGDNRVSVADCAQLGRFAAQLDMLRTDVNEFQRADCAPSTSCGNGRISVADWVQACRYAAALDPIVPACGPTSPTTSALVENSENPHSTTVFTNAGLQTARAVRAIDDTFAIGRKDSLRIELDAQGDENALSFSVEFDPTVLLFDTVLTGKDARGTIFIPNSTQQDSGRVGLVMALSAGQSFSSGPREIAVVVFTVVMNASVDSTHVDFGDQPVVREIVNANADTLSANWLPGKIVITSVVSAIGSEIVTEFSLHQNYPNPFNPTTTIEFSLPRSVHVKLTIFDLLGREIAALVDRSFAAGKYKVDWDASGLESGMYFYRLQAGDDFLQMKKLILMK